MIIVFGVVVAVIAIITAATVIRSVRAVRIGRVVAATAAATGRTVIVAVITAVTGIVRTSAARIVGIVIVGRSAARGGRPAESAPGTAATSSDADYDASHGLPAAR